MARKMPETAPLFEVATDVQLDLFAEPEPVPPARPRALWVRLCDHEPCTMTVPHVHGVR